MFKVISITIPNVPLL